MEEGPTQGDDAYSQIVGDCHHFRARICDCRATSFGDEADLAALVQWLKPSSNLLGVGFVVERIDGDILQRVVVPISFKKARAVLAFSAMYVGQDVRPVPVRPAAARSWVLPRPCRRGLNVMIRLISLLLQVGVG